MPDKFEREIEEILAKLDGDEPSPAKPTPISSARKKAKPARAPRSNPLERVSATTLLFAGAGVMMAGLLLSNFWQPLIWLAFAGVVMFLGAFAWSFKKGTRTAGGGAAPTPQGHFWRDRYITYEPANSSALSKVTRRFRRK